LKFDKEDAEKYLEAVSEDNLLMKKYDAYKEIFEHFNGRDI